VELSKGLDDTETDSSWVKVSHLKHCSSEKNKAGTSCEVNEDQGESL
jgi:hypothetical protein